MAGLCEGGNEPQGSLKAICRRKTRTTGTSTVLTRYDPCDYDDLFTKVKEPLRGTRYNTRDELIRALGRSIRNINKDGRADGVRRLPNIWQKYIDYVLKYITVKYLYERLRLLEHLQSGFRFGRSCSDNIFTIKRIIDKRREYNLPIHIIFIDFEEAFDRVKREKL
ncbi:hypothetical protein ANN_18580 [Periplaneta americana]|uniref:Reverse transcriptase domain-containing protein n=1 Tax=Periplaneta americana TaxID=6978 RepID=A0ABQ8SP57_PERAM|nr:hypothetical protein ANN_18580 [Periplaneta americana]